MIFVQNSQSLKSDDVSDWLFPNKIPGCAPVSGDLLQLSFTALSSFVSVLKWRDI